MKITIRYLSWDRTNTDHRSLASDLAANGQSLPRKFYDDKMTYEATQYNLEDIFERFNIGDHGGGLRAPHMRMRSMSVNDIVEVDGVEWVCASVGWKRVDNTFRTKEVENLVEERR